MLPRALVLCTSVLCALVLCIGAGLGGFAHAQPPVAVAGSPADTGQWAQTILQRPLFSPSRRPAEVEAASTQLPRLAGIVIASHGAYAIFSLSGQSRAVVAGKGAKVGPYLVRDVGAAGVTVDGPSGLQRLHPTYDPDAARGSSSLVSPTPPSILDLLRGRMVHGGAGGSPRPPPLAVPGRLNP